MRESERERESASGESVSRAENRRKRKTSSFGVESKVFEVEMVERGGKPQVIIMERREGRKMGKGLEGDGEKFLLGVRLGVVDSEKKRYNICIPKGRGDKGGWLAMVEALRKLDNSFDKKEQQQEERVLGRSFADTVKGSWNKGSNTLRVEVDWEEINRNLSRLEHCLIGSWIPSDAKGEDLESLAWENDGHYWSLSSWKKQDGSSSLVKGRWEEFSWTWRDGAQGRGVWKKVR
ncbi:hypothetical protein AAG906_025045 [Vitis piasezkii]